MQITLRADPPACFVRCSLPNDAVPSPALWAWSLHPPRTAALLPQEIAIEISFMDGKSIPLKVGMSDSLGTMEDAEAWQAALQQLAHEMRPVEG